MSSAQRSKAPFSTPIPFSKSLSSIPEAHLPTHQRTHPPFPETTRSYPSLPSSRSRSCPLAMAIISDRLRQRESTSTSWRRGWKSGWSKSETRSSILDTALVRKGRGYMMLCADCEYQQNAPVQDWTSCVNDIDSQRNTSPMAWRRQKGHANDHPRSCHSGSAV